MKNSYFEDLQIQETSVILISWLLTSKKEANLFSKINVFTSSSNTQRPYKTSL